MRRQTLLRLLTYGFATTLIGCREDPAQRQEIGPERFGLIAAPEDRALLGAAIEDANHVLSGKGDPSVIPGWLPARTEHGVPVYAVRPDGLGRREIMATHRECGCVIVNVSALTAWTIDAVGSSGALLDVDPRSLLAYMLLHEMGHIANDGSIADRSEEQTRPLVSLNLEPTAQKGREFKADSFAADSIKVSLAQRDTDRALAGSRIALAVTELSWNLAAHRMLDNFGGTILKKPELFWDSGLSHPNLEWRILTVNNMIDGNDTSRQLLEAFETARPTNPSR